VFAGLWGFYIGEIMPKGVYNHYKIKGKKRVFSKKHKENIRKAVIKSRKIGIDNPRWIPRIKRICQSCGKNFEVEKFQVDNGQGKFCSHQCMFDSRKIRTNIKCPNCKKTFSAQIFKIKLNKKHIFCSLKCFREYTKGLVTLICKNCGKEYKTYRSHIKYRGSSCCSKKCLIEYYSGKNNHFWKGGVKFWKRRDTSSLQHKQWREAVFTRDNWTCQRCDARSKAGSPLIIYPHHIKFYAKYPKLRYEVDNGITLCEECHKKTHKEFREKQTYQKIER